MPLTLPLWIRIAPFAMLIVAQRVTAADLGGRDGVYRSYVTGNPEDVGRPTSGLLVLQGGGDDVDENYVRMGAHSGGGDFVVLRASGTDEYNDYIYGLCHCDSVTTLVIEDRSASTDPFVIETIRNAGALFIAGGDQSNYVRYWQDTPKSREAFRGEWFASGDLVRRDADGFYWFEGRVKQIIVRGGSNISPQEVEEALYKHPAVLEAGVIGVPDPVTIERVVAFVVLKEGHAASAGELCTFARQHIADYKAPEEIHFRTELPKNPVGKVQRRALKDMLSAPAQ